MLREFLCIAGFKGIWEGTEGNNVDVNGDEDEPGDPLALTRSMWSLLLNNTLRWANEGWGAYINGNSALYMTAVLDKAEARESMGELIEWGNNLKAAAGKEDVLVIQDESDSFGHCFQKFADGNSAVSIFSRQLTSKHGTMKTVC